MKRRRGNPAKNDDIVNKIREELSGRGIDVAVQYALSTSSAYLSFDGGLLRQARVGDHRGKGYEFLFEIGDHIPKYEEVPGTYRGKPYVRRLYPADAVLDLVRDVATYRAQLRAKYGPEWYEKERARRLAL